MQITVFFIAYTKKSTGANYSFRESGLQITLHLLSSSLGNTVLLHTLFLEYETEIGGKKILANNVFQSNCSSHAKLLTNLRKSKNDLKSDIGWLYSQVFNYCVLGLLYSMYH